MPLKRAVTYAIACLCMALPASMVTPTLAQETAEPGLPAIYESIPVGVQIALVIPSVDRFNRNVALLNRELQLDIPGMSDVLDEFRRTAGMNRGINDKGGLIVAIMDLDAMKGSQQQPPALMLVPIADYAEFVSNFSANAAAPIAELSLSWGQQVYCKRAGDFAVLSARKDLVSNYLPGGAQSLVGKIAGGQGAERLGSCDAALLIDSPRASRALRNQVDAMFDAMQTAKTSDNTTSPTPPNELQTRGNIAIKGLVGEAVSGLLDNTDAIAVTFDISQEGVGLNAAAKFKSGSNLAKIFSEGKNTTDALSHLPAGPYLSAGAADLSGVNMTILSDTLATALTKYNIPWYPTKLQSLAPLVQSVSRVSTVTYTPDELSFTTQLFRQVKLIETDDGRTFAAALHAYIDSLDGKAINLGKLPGPTGAVDPNAPEVQITLRAQYTSAAQVLSGVSVDQYLVEYTFPPQLMAALGQGAGWMMMLTGQQQKGFVAPVGKMVVLTNTDDTQLLERVIKGVSATSGLGMDQGIKKVRGELPKDALYQWYFNVTDVLRLFNQAAKMMAMDVDKLQVKADLAPIGFGATWNGTGMSNRLFMPTAVLKACKQPLGVLYDFMFPPQQPNQEMAQQQQQGGMMPGGMMPGGMMPGGGNPMGPPR